jgi:hypothetical protein
MCILLTRVPTTTGSGFIAPGIPFSTEAERAVYEDPREENMCAIESGGGGGEPYL